MTTIILKTMITMMMIIIIKIIIMVIVIIIIIIIYITIIIFQVYIVHNTSTFVLHRIPFHSFTADCCWCLKENKGRLLSTLLQHKTWLTEKQMNLNWSFKKILLPFVESYQAQNNILLYIFGVQCFYTTGKSASQNTSTDYEQIWIPERQWEKRVLCRLLNARCTSTYRRGSGGTLWCPFKAPLPIVL